MFYVLFYFTLQIYNVGKGFLLQMIIADIAREKALVERELEASQSGINLDRFMLNSLKQKLSNQVTRCKMLHEALARQKGQFQNILEGKYKKRCESNF